MSWVEQGRMMEEEECTASCPSVRLQRHIPRQRIFGCRGRRRVRGHPSGCLPSMLVGGTRARSGRVLLREAFYLLCTRAQDAIMFALRSLRSCLVEFVKLKIVVTNRWE